MIVPPYFSCCIQIVIGSVRCFAESKKSNLRGVQEVEVRLLLRRRSSTLRISTSETESHKACSPRVRPVKTCPLILHILIPVIFSSFISYLSSCLKSCHHELLPIDGPFGALPLYKMCYMPVVVCCYAYVLLMDAFHPLGKLPVSLVHSL